MASRAPPTPQHLASSMRVVASHLHMRRATIAVTNENRNQTPTLAEVGLALHIATGVAGPETEQLAARLEKVTGASIAELDQVRRGVARLGSGPSRALKRRRRPYFLLSLHPSLNCSNGGECLWTLRTARSTESLPEPPVWMICKSTSMMSPLPNLSPAFTALMKASSRIVALNVEVPSLNRHLFPS